MPPSQELFKRALDRIFAISEDEKKKLTHKWKESRGTKDEEPSISDLAEFLIDLKRIG